MKQLIKTANYNFTIEDLGDRLNCIKSFSKKVIEKKITDTEYMSFIEKQIKEVNFINRINEAKRLNISEVEFYG